MSNVVSFPSTPDTNLDTYNAPAPEPALFVADFSAARREQRIRDIASEQWEVYEAVRIPHEARFIPNDDGSITVVGVEINLPAFLFKDLPPA
jgi:hypothetical protein